MKIKPIGDGSNGDYSKVLYVLGLVLVEIRASEKIKKPQVLADIVHNIPASISSGKPEKEIIDDVISRAERQGIEKTFSRYFEMVTERSKK